MLFVQSPCKFNVRENVENPRVLRFTANRNESHAFSFRNLQQTFFLENMNLLSVTLKSAHRKFVNQTAFIAWLFKRRCTYNVWFSPFLLASQCWHARYLRAGCASVFTKHVGWQLNEAGVCSQANYCRSLWRKRDTMQIWPPHISLSLSSDGIQCHSGHVLIF